MNNMTYFSFFSDVYYFINSFFGSLFHTVDLHRYGFATPANDQMSAIVEMFYITAQTMLYILVFIIFIIWAMIYTRNEDIRYPIPYKTWQETLIDIGVIFIPLFIIYLLTAPAVGFILHLDRSLMETPTTINLEVIGHQWYWSYYVESLQNPILLDMFYIYSINLDSVEYALHVLDDLYQCEFDQYMDLDATLGQRYLATTQALVLPVLHYIKVLVTSDDVIHSWALPQLGVKVDAIPGRVQIFLLNSNCVGIFYGQCSELCGVNHAFMPINVEFVEEAQFFDWVFKHSESRGYRLFLNEVIS